MKFKKKSPYKTNNLFGTSKWHNYKHPYLFYMQHVAIYIVHFNCSLKQQNRQHLIFLSQHLFVHDYDSCIITISRKIIYKHSQQNCQNKTPYSNSCSPLFAQRDFQLHAASISLVLRREFNSGDINQIWQVVTHLNAGSRAVCQPTCKSVNQSIMPAVNRCMKNWTSPRAC